MGSTAHLTQKLMAERARLAPTEQRQPHEANHPPPPPYTSADQDADIDNEEEESPSVQVTVNGAHLVRGHNNLVPTAPNTLADGTKSAVMLLQAVKQITHSDEGSARRNVNIHITINCGTNIMGDRNVVGNVTATPRMQPQAGPDHLVVATKEAVVGAKRKVEKDADESPAKRHASDDFTAERFP